MRKDIDPLFFEEEFLKTSKRDSRKERKFAQSKDRSKFKKTDLEKKQEKISPANINLPQGRVLSIIGEKIIVESDQHLFSCNIRGALKKEFSQNKNILAVGDFVHFEKIDSQSGIIVAIQKRFSILSRQEALGKKQHIIAVNIDQVLITASVSLPPLKPSLIDRYIIATMRGKMRPVIVINKIDLLKNDPKEKELYQTFLTGYSKTNIPILSISSKTKEGIKDLEEIMKGRASVFSGHSGVGKSSLINEVTGLNLKTGDVTKKTLKGAHITTTAHLIPLKFGGFCIDTPGIKSFGLWAVKKEELSNYYPDFEPYSLQCRFPNCLHYNEPNCAVIKARDEKKISSLRFESYRSLIEDLNQEQIKR